MQMKMKYRKLGKTGFDISAIGLGGVQLSSSNTEYAVKIVHKALELGVNYFDTARIYGNSEIKLGLGLKGNREKVYISTKTIAETKEEAWQNIMESLERLQTDYLDNCHLHALQEKDIEKRLGPGGALEALIEARKNGVIRNIGCTSHTNRTLVKALKRFDFDTILLMMNIVEREPLDELIPLCESKGVGVTIMKPLATGLLPSKLALKWLLNQPIATAVPGATTLEEVEENSLAGHLDDFTLTAEEENQVKHLTDQFEHVRCRMCGECEPCPVGISLLDTLGSDDMYNHYRTMGSETFRHFPWDIDKVRNHVKYRRQKISAIQSCTECGECEKKCPYGLPIIKMLRGMVENMEDMLEIWKKEFNDLC